jgi:hypothetical protein
MLPPLRISEDWGESTGHEREIIEMFVDKLGGGSGSLEDFFTKIHNMQTVINACQQESEVCAPDSITKGTVFANLVVLESLASIVYDFSASSAGFLFESLMAALMGGKQLPATQRMPGPGGETSRRPIEDIVVADGQPISLKFLRKTNSIIKGSEDNLKAALQTYKTPITYIVALKDWKKAQQLVAAIDFYTFTVGGTVSVPNAQGEEEMVAVQGNVEFDQIGEGWTVGQLKGQLKPQATLTLGSHEELKKKAQVYATFLGEELEIIYSNIEALSLNVNEYFINDQNNTAPLKSAAQNSRKITRTIKSLETQTVGDE